MNYLTQTQLPELANFIIRVDGEVIEPERPSAYVRASQSLSSALHGAIEHIKLETALIIYDRLHDTHYRSIRHDLISAKRNADWEAKIGLVKK